jgi:hypothetical protein
MLGKERHNNSTPAIMADEEKNNKNSQKAAAGIEIGDFPHSHSYHNMWYGVYTYYFLCSHTLTTGGVTLSEV